MNASNSTSLPQLGAPYPHRINWVHSLLRRSMSNTNVKAPRASIYILLGGLTYNTRGYVTSCVVFFRAPQGRGKMRATRKMSTRIIC